MNQPARPAFQIELGALRSRSKDTSAAAVELADSAAERHGFVDREPKKKRGRPPSGRTGQVHAKVFPYIADEIAAEALRRGCTQGVLIEEAWAFYCTRREAQP